MLTTSTVHLVTLSDAYGEPLAEYYNFPENALLYIRWHGQLTAEEVIRGAQEAERLMVENPYDRVLNDKRDTGGDWTDALPWLQYEWLPKAVAAGLRATAYILSPDLHAQIVSQKFVEAVQDQIQISLFTNEADAEQWLRRQ